MRACAPAFCRARACNAYACIRSMHAADQIMDVRSICQLKRTAAPACASLCAAAIRSSCLQLLIIAFVELIPLVCFVLDLADLLKRILHHRTFAPLVLLQ